MNGKLEEMNSRTTNCKSIKNLNPNLPSFDC